MDMQYKVDMRRKDLYLAEGKISTLDWVGCDTTTLCWGRENIRSLPFCGYWFKTSIFLMLLQTCCLH